MSIDEKEIFLHDLINDNKKRSAFIFGKMKEEIEDKMDIPFDCKGCFVIPGCKFIVNSFECRKRRAK